MSLLKRLLEGMLDVEALVMLSSRSHQPQILTMQRSVMTRALEFVGLALASRITCIFVELTMRLSLAVDTATFHHTPLAERQANRTQC